IADGEDFRTLTETLALFPEGEYSFDLDSGASVGSTNVTHNIPAAPADVHFNGRKITWAYGDDLGECTTWPEGFSVADEADIAGYEVVMEPDVDGLSHFKLTIRVPANVYHLRVPTSYLQSFEPDTPLKIEVGAIEEREDGTLGNQTFTEEGGFCARRNQKRCKLEEEQEE
ncbi:MAG: hypothetical protein HKN19_02545, partial [Halioglobus sp.]|nr:hypothetical protein [Halioglobus sp.]